MGSHGIKHGQRDTPEYSVWRSMKKRCQNSNGAGFKDYGGRGIKVCRRWLDAFEWFLLDMGPRPTSSHSLDRYPDLNGDYEPGNCRWATPIEQQSNRRNNRLLEYGGKVQTVAEWSRQLAIKRFVLYQRLDWGWSVERCLTEPVRLGSRPGRTQRHVRVE